MIEVVHSPIPKDQRLAWRDLRWVRRDIWSILLPANPQRYDCLLARNAIFHGLRALGIRPGERILVPAYICAAAVAPIVSYGAKVDFYNLGARLEPDSAALCSAIRPDTRALLMVHYFGFPQQMSAIREICTRHRLYLVEDCAHVLYGSSDDQSMGTFGDISVYSWRKQLPVQDGAALVLNRTPDRLNIEWTRESRLVLLKSLKDLLDSLTGGEDHWLRRLTHSLTRPAVRLLQRRAMPDLRTDWHGSNVADSYFDPSAAGLPMTRVSRWLMSRIDVRAVSAARRDHYRYLDERLAQIPGVERPFSPLPERVCPWVFPLLFKRVSGAVAALRQFGIPAVSWAGVRPAELDVEAFPSVASMYENLVFLPVHPSLQRVHLDRIVDAVRQTSHPADGRIDKQPAVPYHQGR